MKNNFRNNNFDFVVVVVVAVHSAFIPLYPFTEE